MATRPLQPVHDLGTDLSQTSLALRMEASAQRHATLTEKHYAAIGRVAADWAFLEALIDNWSFSFAMTEPNIGTCFTAQILGPRGKLDALISLIHQRGARKTTLRALETFASDTTPLAESRNRAVHDPWFFDDPNLPTRFHATARKRLSRKEIKVPTAKLVSTASHTQNHRRRFERLMVNALAEMNAKLQASHEKQQRALTRKDRTPHPPGSASPSQIAPR